MATYAITGHRPSKLGNDYTYTSPLVQWIRERLIDIIESNDIDKMISGMALGIDTIWAELAIGYNIPLIAAIPFSTQADKWPKESQTRYYRLLDKATVVNVSGKVNYKPEYMQQRNIWMVDQLVNPNDILVAVWDGTSGGTANCVKYAINKIGENRIIRINPKDYIS